MTREVYATWGVRLSSVALFLLPFKLTLGYFGLIPLILLWLLYNFRDLRKPLAEAPILYPFIAFIIIAISTSIFGINPERSFSHIGTLLFFPLAIFAFKDALESNLNVPLRSVLLGASVSSLIRICEHIVPSLNLKFLGAVSQAGQFTLILPLALGFYELLRRLEPDQNINRSKVLGVIFGALSILSGFADKLQLPALFGISLLAILLLYTAISIVQWIRGASSFQQILVSTLVPLIVAALVVNLKRGPWLGIGVGISIFLWFYSRRTLIFVSAVCIACLLLEPVQTRIDASLNHFFIAGGRSAIWEIGAVLIKKYPLGIGFENSGFLRSFSQEIPRELKHFHSNLLNVAVELGWLGLVMYIASFLKVIYSSIKEGIIKNNPILASAGCALVAWQVAGLVEYNFGDAAVVALGYFGMALTLALLKDDPFSSQKNLKGSY